MTLLLIGTLLLSGHCRLSSGSRQFHVVREPKTWAKAQQYCREKFIDLATIDNMSEMQQVTSLIQGAGSTWIGLKQGKWRWSLADRYPNRENETSFLNWASRQPDAAEERCVSSNEKWHNYDCNLKHYFICYDGGSLTRRYVLVTEAKTWTDAQRYCREKHTDLASVRNQIENDLINTTRQGNLVWIGLFRDAWEWSDGSTSSFHHWNSGEPNYGYSSPGCTLIATITGQWDDRPCDHQLNFICYEVPKVRWHMVRVGIQVDSQVNIHNNLVQQDILQQIQERLREKGMPADTKVTWSVQPDGKIFHKKEKKQRKSLG